MSTTTTFDARYPIGRFSPPSSITPADRARWMDDLTALPAELRSAVAGLTDEQLDTPYRDGGWTLRQVVHHLTDSHINSYARFRLALTELAPTIRPYDEVLWAELPDARSGPTEMSLALLTSLHGRWVFLLRTLGEDEWRRTFVHPEHGRTFRLDETLALYAWHGRHHVAHIRRLRERMGW